MEEKVKDEGKAPRKAQEKNIDTKKPICPQTQESHNFTL